MLSNPIWLVSTLLCLVSVLTACPVRPQVWCHKRLSCDTIVIGILPSTICAGRLLLSLLVWKCRYVGSSSANPRRSHSPILPEQCLPPIPAVPLLTRRRRGWRCVPGAGLPLGSQALFVTGCRRSTVDRLEQVQREDHHGVQCTARSRAPRFFPNLIVPCSPYPICPGSRPPLSCGPGMAVIFPSPYPPLYMHSTLLCNTIWHAASTYSMYCLSYAAWWNFCNLPGSRAV